MIPSGSLEAVASKSTKSGASPDGVVVVKLATGGWLAGAEGVVTCRLAELLLTAPWEAVMEVAPAERAVARPEEPIVATVLSELTQVAVEVRSTVLESLKVPVAVNCWICPSSIETVVGVTAMEVKVGGGVVRSG